MAYTPTIWKNREVEKPRTFQLQNNPDSTVTLIPKEGNVIESGTPIIADNMNKMEQGIKDAHDLLVDIGDVPSQFAEHKADDAIDAHNASNISVLDIAGLFTATNVEGALKESIEKANQAFQSASDGKTAIANAVTAKGVAASPSDTFPALATKIGQINTGKKWASGRQTAVANQISVNNLSFTPKLVIARYFPPTQLTEDFAVYVKKEMFTQVPSTDLSIINKPYGAGAFTFTSNGFTITVSGNYDFTWIAIE